MKNVMFFSTIEIYILITFFANSIDADKIANSCKYRGKRCIPFDKQPCCEENYECLYVDGFYVCKEEAYLGLQCDKNSTCASGIKNAICDDSHRCACKYSYTAVGTRQCAVVLNALCDDNEPCAPLNSKCINGVCQCEPNFEQQSSTCRRKYLDEPCQTFLDCNNHFRFSNCSPRKKCTCDFNYITYNKTMCVPSIGEFCISNDNCFIENSICIELTCQCKPKHLMSSTGQCVAVSSIKSCYKNVDCIAYKNSHCSKIGKCFCNSNLAAIEKNSCVPELGDYCRENHPCTIENSVCIDNKCQSKFDDSKEILGGPCQRNSDCNDRENLVCSENNLCICKSNFTSFRGNKCKVPLNGVCTNYTECISRNSHCINNKCQCQSNYTQISTHQCINSNDVYSCFDALDCSDPWHANCIDGKCVCTENHIAFNKATCYPLLGGRCWNPHQCLAKNSECSDFHCRCKQDFVQVSESTCLPKK